MVPQSPRLEQLGTLLPPCCVPQNLTEILAGGAGYVCESRPNPTLSSDRHPKSPRPKTSPTLSHLRPLLLRGRFGGPFVRRRSKCEWNDSLLVGPGDRAKLTCCLQ